MCRWLVGIFHQHARKENPPWTIINCPRVCNHETERQGSRKRWSKVLIFHDFEKYGGLFLWLLERNELLPQCLWHRRERLKLKYSCKVKVLRKWANGMGAALSRTYFPLHIYYFELEKIPGFGVMQAGTITVFGQTSQAECGRMLAVMSVSSYGH